MDRALVDNRMHGRIGQFTHQAASRSAGLGGAFILRQHHAEAVHIEELADLAAMSPARSIAISRRSRR